MKANGQKASASRIFSTFPSDPFYIPIQQGEQPIHSPYATATNHNSYATVTQPPSYFPSFTTDNTTSHSEGSLAWSTNTSTPHYTNTVPDVEPLLDLGAWQHDWATDISPFTTVSSNPEHELAFQDSGHKYNHQAEYMGTGATAHTMQELVAPQDQYIHDQQSQEHLVQPRESSNHRVGTREMIERHDDGPVQPVQTGDGTRMDNQYEQEPWDRNLHAGHAWP